MSTFITRDFLGPAVGITNMNHALYRRMTKVWPRASHDNNYYAKQFRFYEDGWPESNGATVKWWFDQDERRGRFTNAVGINEEFLTDQKYTDAEVDYAYFKLAQPGETELDPDRFTFVNADKPFTYAEAIKYVDGYTDEDQNEVPGAPIATGSIFTARVTYAGELKSYMAEDSFVIYSTNFDPDAYDENDESTWPENNVERPFTDAEILAKILDNPFLYLLPTNQNIVERLYAESTYQDHHLVNKVYNYTSIYQMNRYYSPVAVVEIPKVFTSNLSARYGLYAMFDVNKTTFKRTIKRITSESDPDVDRGFTADITYEAIAPFTSSSECFTSYIDEFNLRNAPMKSASATFVRPVHEDYRIENPIGDIDAIVNGNTLPLWKDGYLNVDTCRLIKRKDFRVLFGESFDLDQKIMEASAWEKAAFFLIIIIAIVVGVFTYGLGTPGILAAAGAFGAAGITLAVGGGLLAYYGGASASGYVKIIGQVGQAVGWIGTILGIYAIVQNISKAVTERIIANAVAKGAEEAVVRAALEVGDIAITETLSAALDVATDALVGYVNLSAMSTTEVLNKLITWTDNAYTTYRYYDENYGEMADMKAEAEDIQKEIDELEKLNEENAAGRMDLAFTETFRTSYGSYDALEELSKKMEFSLGGNSEMMDPVVKLT